MTARTINRLLAVLETDPAKRGALAEHIGQHMQDSDIAEEALGTLVKLCLLLRKHGALHPELRDEVLRLLHDPEAVKDNYSTKQRYQESKNAPYSEGRTKLHDFIRETFSRGTYSHGEDSPPPAINTAGCFAAGKTETLGGYMDWLASEGKLKTRAGKLPIPSFLKETRALRSELNYIHIATDIYLQFLPEVYIARMFGHEHSWKVTNAETNDIAQKMAGYARLHRIPYAWEASYSGRDAVDDISIAEYRDKLDGYELHAVIVFAEPTNAKRRAEERELTDHRKVTLVDAVHSFKGASRSMWEFLACADNVMVFYTSGTLDTLTRECVLILGDSAKALYEAQEHSRAPLYFALGPDRQETDYGTVVNLERFCTIAEFPRLDLEAAAQGIIAYKGEPPLPETQGNAYLTWERLLEDFAARQTRSAPSWEELMERFSTPRDDGRSSRS